MPDHLHALLTSENLSASLSSVVRTFKGAAAARARQFGISNLWQKRFYDHVIRSNESLEKITTYVLENPVRAGLIAAPGDWPFSGPRALIPRTASLGSSHVPP
jgi:putative transposase